MFIPTTYTGKGKPVAFFPDTMIAGNLWSNKLQKYARIPNLLLVSAYWHEVKKGKQIACYGYVGGWLPEKDFPDGIDNPNFSFGDFLEIATIRNYKTPQDKSGCWVGFTGLHKLGHSKPWKAPAEFFLDGTPEAAYDPQVLANMITNPSQVPAGAVGWFKLAANKTDTK
jgi:hypothetical protein